MSLALTVLGPQRILDEGMKGWDESIIPVGLRERPRSSVTLTVEVGAMTDWQICRISGLSLLTGAVAFVAHVVFRSSMTAGVGPSVAAGQSL